MPSNAVCWTWESRTQTRPKRGAFGKSLMGGGTETVRVSGPVPKRGHTMGRGVTLLGEHKDGQEMRGPASRGWICARCGAVYVEVDGDE